MFARRWHKYVHVSEEEQQEQNEKIWREPNWHIKYKDDDPTEDNFEQAFSRQLGYQEKEELGG